LVHDGHPVDDESVEESRVDTAYLDFCSQFLRQQSRRFVTYIPLEGRDMERGNHQDIKSDDSPDSDAEYTFENLHVLFLLERAICQTEIAIFFDAL
jgi:hypothetical protein